MGLRARGLVGLDDAGDWIGFERLLDRPKSSFAADATVQPPPPPVLLSSPLFMAAAMPGLEMPPGPPSPAAEPVRANTCDAIVVSLGGA